MVVVVPGLVFCARNSPKFFFFCLYFRPFSGQLYVFCLQPILLLLSNCFGHFVALLFWAPCMYIYIFVASGLPIPCFVLEHSILFCLYAIAEALLLFSLFFGTVTSLCFVVFCGCFMGGL